MSRAFRPNLISPSDFGRISHLAARWRKLGLGLLAIRKICRSEFSRLDRQDVDDAVEGAVEQWDRLQIREPQSAERTS